MKIYTAAIQTLILIVLILNCLETVDVAHSLFQFKEGVAEAFGALDNSTR